MTFAHKRVIAQIHRFGLTATVKVRSTTGQNAFGNVTDKHTADRTVIAFRTYPNRNTEVETRVGDYERDNPVFLVPDDEDNTPPGENDVLEYDGQDYEVKALTVYDTHVEFFGEPVIHDESSQ